MLASVYLLSFKITLASRAVKAYFNRFLNTIDNGMLSLNLCGPYEGLVDQFPPVLSNIQLLGAKSLFKCFFGPLVIFLIDCDQRKTLGWI